MITRAGAFVVATERIGRVGVARINTSGVRMGKFVDALKAGVKAATDNFGPGSYSAGQRQVRCGHCEGTTFALRQIPGTEVGSISPWAGFTLVCQDCTRVELFAACPERM